MSETQRRELERAAASGDPRATQCLRRERMRTCVMPVSRIELLARLGHEPAQRLLAPRFSSVQRVALLPTQLPQLARRANLPEIELTLRVALAAGRSALRLDGIGAPRSSRQRRLLSAAEAYLVGPSQARVRVLEAAFLRLVQKRRWGPHPFLGPTAREDSLRSTVAVGHLGHLFLMHAAANGWSVRTGTPREFADRHHVLYALLHCARDGLCAPGRVSRRDATRLLLQAIADDLTPWVLGEGDLVAARVGALREVMRAAVAERHQEHGGATIDGTHRS